MGLRVNIVRNLLRVWTVTEIAGVRVVMVGVGEGRKGCRVNRGWECYILGAEERHTHLWRLSG